MNGLKKLLKETVEAYFEESGIFRHFTGRRDGNHEKFQWGYLMSQAEICTYNLPVINRHLYHLSNHFVVHFICGGQMYIKAKHIYHFIFYIKMSITSM